MRLRLTGAHKQERVLLPAGEGATTSHRPPLGDANKEPRATRDTFAFNCYPRLWPFP